MLTHLSINYLRNLDTIEINPGSHFNVFYGNNGSGKTSILEAIHFLSVGKSFRTHLAHRAICHNHSHFSIFGKILNRYQQLIPLGIEKNRKGNTQIRINNQDATTTIQLAEHLPIQLINSDSFKLLSAGPLYRRKFIDWGVFHKDASFYTLWDKAQRILQQRNIALKSGSARKQLIHWDQTLVPIAQQLTVLRENYLKDFSPLFLTFLQQLLEESAIELNFYQGWKDDLFEVLDRSYLRDSQLGYTQFGPHRADLILKMNNIPAQETLSQGQQKLLTYALRLAQGSLLKTQGDKSCIFLIDDLPAELDSDKRRRSALLLSQIQSQVFVTGVDCQGLRDFLNNQNQPQVFHVKQGSITNY